MMKIRLNNDLLSHPALMEGLGKHTHSHIPSYIYIYIEREREGGRRELEGKKANWNHFAIFIDSFYDLFFLWFFSPLAIPGMKVDFVSDPSWSKYNSIRMLFLSLFFFFFYHNLFSLFANYFVLLQTLAPPHPDLDPLSHCFILYFPALFFCKCSSMAMNKFR